MNYYKLLISAGSEEEAKRVRKTLLEKKLIAGAAITKAPSEYWWKGKITKENCLNISAWTSETKKEEIKKVVKEISDEEIPVIAFFKIEDANQDFLNWIKENIKK